MNESMMNFTPYCGCTLFTRGNSPLNKITVWTTTGKNERPTLATHQGIFISSTDMVEATYDGVMKQYWPDEKARLYRTGVEWAIVRIRKPLTTEAEKWIQSAALEEIGWKYSRVELVLCFLDGMWEKATGRETVYWRKLGDLWRNRVICSKTANRPLIKAGVLPKIAEYYTPDDTWDYMIKHTETFEVCDYTARWYNPRLNWNK